MEDSGVTHEHPIVPHQDKSGSFPVSIPDTDPPVESSRVSDSIDVISEYRIREGATPEEIRQYSEVLSQKLAGIIREEKVLRIERVKLSRKLENLHRKNLEYKKDRLKKDSRIATLKSRCSAVKVEIHDGGPSEIERLEKRKIELESDIAMFQDTMEVHRRDRIRTLVSLQSANSRLQDVYTEEVLDRIIKSGIKKEGADEDREEEADLSALAAEILGRLLVLEREESYLFGVINRIDKI